MNKSKYFLYGASGHGKVILEILESLDIKVEGFFDDGERVQNSILNTPVLGKFLTYDWDQNDTIIISIGNNIIRKKVSNELKVSFGKAIHQKSIISPSSSIDEGTVVMGGAVVNAQTTIGKHCIINTNASIDHDCVIEDFVHISPNVALAGNVKVKAMSHIGIGASIIQGVVIGENVTIGAGTVVINDVPDNTVVVGCPGRVIKYKEIENG
ncbi:Acetyltransferase [Tenacibaculum sp. 190130A14a]|uniref:Acetyltransferase n=1 Tax=Tenacibaculum polynesiense TaxID=3137857 RepID=A0ABM9PD46_9FLAO